MNNYKRALSEFWHWQDSNVKFSSGANLLFYYLLFEYHLQGCKDFFICENKELKNAVGIKYKKEFNQTRHELFSAGLILYSRGKEQTKYSLVPFFDKITTI